MPKWSHVVFLAAAALGGLACSVTDRLMRGPALTAPQAVATATAAAEVVITTAAAPTPEGSRRLVVDATPTPFTVPEDDIRASLDLAHPDYFDAFNNPETWFDFDNANRAAAWIADGKLFALDYEPEEIFTWWTYSDRASGNVYVEVSATNGDCIERDSVGLALRVDRQSAAGGYSLEVSCDGAWRFRLHQIGGDQVELIDWTAADAIRTGPAATNRLAIWAYQARFRFYINGEQVGDYWDVHYRHSYGAFALYTRASRTFDLISTFDDFAFWNIDFVP